MSKLTIGKLAKVAQVNVETVRFYERKGLIKQPRKTSGYREYDKNDPKRIRFIKRAQELGFTLNEVKELLGLNVNSRATCAHVAKKAAAKIEEVEAKIADLQRMRGRLKELERACDVSKDAMACCQVMDCFDDEGSCSL